jgi:uncharacterized membrane protein
MPNPTTAKAARPLSLEEFRKQRKPPRNVNREASARLTMLDKVAVWITRRVGTMGFFLVIVGWTVLWLGWNLLAPANLQFDPPMAFVFWLFISNMVQIFLMPLIMVGQNIQGRHSELRADRDFEVNIKAEREIEIIMEHLEYQNSILIAMVEKLGVSVGDVSPKSTPQPKKPPAKRG